MDMILGFPHVVSFRVSFPFEEELQLLSSSLITMVSYSLDFILFFSVYDIRGQADKIRTMMFHLLVWEQ